MWQILRQSPGALLFAILVHVLAFMAIALSFSWEDKHRPVATEIKVMEAVAIDEKKIAAEKEKKHQQQMAKQRAEQERQRKIQEAKALKAKQEREKRERIAAEKKNKARLEKEKKARAARQKKQQAEMAEKLEREKKAREEAERRAKQAEEKRQKEAAAQRNASEIERYQGLIQRDISQNWLIPASFRKGMTCVLAVRMIPGGEVVSVRIIKSSGDSAFDRSVEQAVQKASPLPVPTIESGLFNQFREINLTFDPAKL